MLDRTASRCELGVLMFCRIDADDDRTTGEKAGPLERTDCRNLVLHEPNIEFYYHSLFTFDWVSLCGATYKRLRYHAKQKQKDIIF